MGRVGLGWLLVFDGVGRGRETGRAGYRCVVWVLSRLFSHHALAKKHDSMQVGELIVGPAKAKGPAVGLSDLVKVRTLGTGTFGRVKLVQHRKTKQVCVVTGGGWRIEDATVLGAPCHGVNCSGLRFVCVCWFACDARGSVVLR